LSKTESDLIERHFRSAGYRDASEGHGQPGWVWNGVARPVPAVADLAGTTTLTTELSAALDGVRGSRPRHDPGRVLVDLAVAIADGAEAISDIAVLADQPALFRVGGLGLHLLAAAGRSRRPRIPSSVIHVLWPCRRPCGVSPSLPGSQQASGTSPAAGSLLPGQ